MLNLLLQGKFEPVMEGSARLVFNTTLGIGGLFDVATRCRQAPVRRGAEGA